jgi:hypothetical protein
LTERRDRRLAEHIQRSSAAALEIVLRRKADMPKHFVAEFTEHADDAWITANGAQMVARAWTDPEYRARMVVRAAPCGTRGREGADGVDIDYAPIA